MKLSIITIVFNNKDSIAQCIESMRFQSYANVEHVLIDGGSTDGTLEIIENYKDDLGYFVSEMDNGLYDALNKGIQKCTGDVIGILHSDDLYYKKIRLKKNS